MRWRKMKRSMTMTTKDSKDLLLPDPDPPINTANEFYLGSQSGGAVIMPGFYPALRTRQQAYRFAAWCATMGETLPDEPAAHTFEQIRDAIRNS